MAGMYVRLASRNVIFVRLSNIVRQRIILNCGKPPHQCSGAREEVMEKKIKMEYLSKKCSKLVTLVWG
jgi:transposase